MSLAERALLGSEQKRDPRSMQLGTTRNLKTTDEKTPDIKPVSEIRQRQQHATQIIEEQREMFFSNLLISRHQKELDRLEIQKKAQEAKLISMDLEAREAQNRSKTTNNQYENMRNRERQKLDQEIRKKVTVEGQFKKKQQRVRQLEIETTKLDEVLQQYRSYYTFLQETAKLSGRYPKTTADLVDFFDKLESENLFIIQNVDTIKVKNEENLESIAAETAATQRILDDLDEQLEYYQGVKESLSSSSNTGGQTVTFNTNDKLDKDLAVAQKAISKVFKECFTGGSSQNSLAMLQLIESKLESMTQEIKSLDPDSVMSKLKVITEEKRKKQRELNNEKKRQQSEMKFNNMMKRATQPIKQKTGRPLTARVLPSKIKRRDESMIEREAQERKRIQEMLYGPVFD